MTMPRHRATVIAIAIATLLTAVAGAEEGDAESRASLAADSSLLRDFASGETRAVAVTLSNLDATARSFTVTAEVEDAAWSVAPASRSVDVEAGGFATLGFAITAPTVAGAADATLELRALDASTSEDLAELEAPVTLARAGPVETAGNASTTEPPPARPDAPAASESANATSPTPGPEPPAIEPTVEARQDPVAAGEAPPRSPPSSEAPLDRLAALARENPGATIAVAAAGTATFGAMLLARREWLRWLALVPLAGLYSRIERRTVLDHASRDRLAAVVAARPGVTLAELTRELALHSAAVVHHARTLERNHVIASRREGARRRFYPVGARLPPMPAPDALTPAEARLLALLESGPRSQSELARDLGVSRQAVHQHVKALSKKGQLTVDFTGESWVVSRAGGSPADARAP